MIGGNSIAKIRENIYEFNAKISPENFLPLPRNRKNTHKISFSDYVNDHAYSIKIRPTLNGFSQS